MNSSLIPTYWQFSNELWEQISPINLFLIDASGLNCPLPLLKLKQALKAHHSFVYLIATDSNSQQDIVRYANHASLLIHGIHSIDNSYHFVIEKASINLSLASPTSVE